MTDKIEEIRARHDAADDDRLETIWRAGLAMRGAVEEIKGLRAEVERLHKAHQAACEGGDLLRAELMQAIGLLEARLDTAIRERDESRAEVERLRAEKEALYASIAGIERAAAGAIYSQESIHAMALYALKPLMERGIEAVEAKP